MAINSIAAPRAIPHQKPLGAAYVWLLLFTGVNFARPEDWIPGLSNLPIAAITGGLAVVALMFSLGSYRQRLPREVIYLILLFVQLWIAVPMSPVWRGGAFNAMRDFTKVLPIIVVMALVLNTIKKIRWLILVETASVATIAAARFGRDMSFAGAWRACLAASIQTLMIWQSRLR